MSSVENQASPVDQLGDPGADPKVAVLGAGAMGCLFGGLLAEGGLDVTFVDKWQAHVDVLNSTGLKLMGVGGERTLKVKAVSDPSTLKDPFDFVIVQCKSMDTKDAVESLKHCFNENTVAVSWQNGLGNEDIIAEVLGSADNVFGGQTLQGAHIEGAGVVHIHTNLDSYMGEWRGGTSLRCARFCKIFTRAGLPTLEDGDMKKKIWMKVIYNCVVSPLSTLTAMQHKQIYGRKDAIYVANIIIKEALAVARAEGLEISEEEAKECLDKVIASNQSNKSSMCVDVENKRRSEIDFINGRITFLAEKHDIDVPFNRAMTFFVNCLQSHYTGE